MKSESSYRTASETARAYFLAWNQHDVQAAAGLFDKEGTFQDNTMNSPLPQASLAEAFSPLLATVPDLHFEVTLVFQNEAGLALAEWHMKGNTGRVDLPGVDVFEVREGMIQSARAYFDATTLARQLGAGPAAANA